MRMLLIFVTALVLALANSQNDLATANNRFAFELYKRIATEKKKVNVFFSPVSISTAFGMVNLGARGSTRRQLKSVLQLDKFTSEDNLKYDYRQMITTFSRQDNDYTLHIANRLFGSNEFSFSHQFQEESRQYFQSGVEALNFKTQPDPSRMQINDWVERETSHKIKNMLPRDSISPATILVVVNAIYFNGTWQHKFHTNSTRFGTFHTTRTDRAEVQMMDFGSSKQLNYFLSYELDCHVVELPYFGGRASMVIFVPREIDGLPMLEERMTMEKLMDAWKTATATDVRLKLPKFAMEQSISLKEFLEEMGLRDIFSISASDLSGLGGPGRLVVNKVFHKSCVNVSEGGTEAAGATQIDFSRIAYQGMPRPVEVVVDRPFLFMILEKNTNAVLFLGRLVQPRVSGERLALGDGERPNGSIGFVLLSIVALLFTAW